MTDIADSSATAERSCNCIPDCLAFGGRSDSGVFTNAAGCLDHPVDIGEYADRVSVLGCDSTMLTLSRFKELRHKTQLLQEGILKELMSHMDCIVKAQEHTADSLGAVRSFAEGR